MKRARTVAISVLTVLCAPLAHALVPFLTAAAVHPSPLPPRLPLDESPSVTFVIPRYTLSDDEREIIASCLVLEAASQGEFGMRGVMAVIRNRSDGHPEAFAQTVLREKQFSALNKLTAGRESRWRLVHRAQQDQMWATALRIVDEATQDDWRDPTGGATHYTRTGEHTPWTRMLAKTVTIGRHAFYR